MKASTGSSAGGRSQVTAAGAALALKPSRVPQDYGAFDLEDVVRRSFGDWSVDPGIDPRSLPRPMSRANLEKLYAQIVTARYINSRRRQSC